MTGLIGFWQRAKVISKAIALHRGEWWIFAECRSRHRKVVEGKVFRLWSNHAQDQGLSLEPESTQIF